MRAVNDTRQKRVGEGLDALLRSGYDGVGLAGILTSAAVPKGSFYHFFKSKEDFVLEIVDGYERHYVELRATYFGDASRSPLTRLDDYFAALELLHVKEQPFGGCLFGVLAQTATSRSAKFRKRLSKVFVQWASQLEALLREAQSVGEVDVSLDSWEAASFVIDAYEGALIRMKVEGEPKAFSRFRKYALRSIVS